MCARLRPAGVGGRGGGGGERENISDVGGYQGKKWFVASVSSKHARTQAWSANRSHHEPLGIGDAARGFFEAPLDAAHVVGGPYSPCTCVDMMMYGSITNDIRMTIDPSILRFSPYAVGNSKKRSVGREEAPLSPSTSSVGMSTCGVTF